jgi:hypothetical protein
MTSDQMEHPADNIPVPFNCTVNVGVSWSLDGMESVAFLLPVAVGVNVTLTVQLSDWASVIPAQPFSAMVKSPALVPPNATVPRLKFVVPVFWILATFPSEIVLTPTFPKTISVALSGSVTAMFA